MSLFDVSSIDFVLNLFYDPFIIRCDSETLMFHNDVISNRLFRNRRLSLISRRLMHKFFTNPTNRYLSKVFVDDKNYNYFLHVVRRYVAAINRSCRLSTKPPIININ